MLKRILKPSGLLLVSALIMSGCETTKTNFQNREESSSIGPMANLSRDFETPLIKEGVKNLKDGDIDSASEKFQFQLKLTPQHAVAHFFNGLCYHLKGRQGDEQYLDLAKTGYEMAAKFDSSNPVYFHHKGLVEIAQKDYNLAQGSFATAYMLNPGDVRPLYGMAVSSYHNRDLETASVAISKAIDAKPNNPLYLRTGAIVAAAVNKHDLAQVYAQRLASIKNVHNADISYVNQRINGWHTFYKDYQRKEADLKVVSDTASVVGGKVGSLSGANTSKSGFAKADYTAPSITNPFVEDKGNTDQSLLEGDVTQRILGAASQPKPLDTSNQMVAVDVVIMIAEETSSEGYGVNLLDGLKLTFGGSGAVSSGALTANTLWTNSKTSTKTVGTNTIINGLGISLTTAAAYSLNIANVGGDRNEIIARPTLTALSGQQATFSSGNDIIVAGTGDNSMAGPFNLGITLVITPTLMKDGKVALNIQASRKNASSNATSTAANSFPSALYTSHTTIQSVVTMNMNDTMIMGGLTERTDSSSSDGTPILRDIPGIQYLFGRKTTSQFRKSVIFLVTPRYPDYTYIDGFGGPDAKASSPSVQALFEFKNRYTDWFKPDPNLAQAFKHFQTIGVYREFRNGDAIVEDWNNLERVLEDVYVSNGQAQGATSL